MTAIMKTRFGVSLRRSLPFVCLLAMVGPASWPQAAPAAQSPAAPDIARASEFRKLSADIAYDRAHWRDSTQKSQEDALEILDLAVLSALNGSKAPDLASLNVSLAALPEASSSDQSFRVSQLGTDNPVYALTANFGANGPSALRIYSLQSHSYELLGRIDRFSEPAFFDDSMILLPLEKIPGIFVTVTGRTDSLSTGMFGAWRFAGGRLQKLWLSELLVHSTFIAQSDGLQLDYCGQPDDADPAICHQTLRDVYAWKDNAWKRISQAVVPPAGCGRTWLATDAHIRAAGRKSARNAPSHFGIGCGDASAIRVCCPGSQAASNSS